ncbi:MAG: universal stress protein [Candidatus Saliniplasma sp.]
MFNKILIATDNSPLMKRAMEYTATIFPYADYHLINVINTSDGSIPQTRLMQRRLKEISSGALRSGKKVLKDMGISDIKVAMPEGTPSRQITGYITKNDIDLLVMATHSKEGAQEVHIGETALHSLQITSIPSLIFSCKCNVRIPKKIFNPTTFSSYSVDATMVALNLASHFGASLTTYHIGSHDPGHAARRVKRRAEKDEVDFELVIDKDASDEKILDVSEKFDFMVGSRGRGGLLYRFRFLFPRLALSNLEKELIADSSIPFLLVGD